MLGKETRNLGCGWRSSGLHWVWGLVVYAMSFKHTLIDGETVGERDGNLDGLAEGELEGVLVIGDFVG